MKLLEEKNRDNLTLGMEREEEAKKANALKSQLEILKRQVGVYKKNRSRYKHKWTMLYWLECGGLYCKMMVMIMTMTNGDGDNDDDGWWWQ